MNKTYSAYYSSACYSAPLFDDKEEHIEAQPCSRYDVITFLALVNSRELDIFQTLWDEASPTLGDGGTAVVSQAVMDGKRGIAFKRLGGKDAEAAVIDNERSAESRAYRALMSEISILTHPAIREHPGFINVEAVCWEIDAAFKHTKILPVLIFEKAPHGDLSDYVLQQQQIGYQAVLDLFCAILDAVGHLHACEKGLIHGDLKPKNILIFESEDGHLLPKLADFGFSLQETDSAIKLPVSPGWNAPEVDTSYPSFTFMQAMKADIFSLGLILLWLMYRASRPGKAAPAVDADMMDLVEDSDSSDWIKSARQVQNLGDKAAIVEDIHHALRSHTTQTFASNIEQVLRITLCVQSQQRAKSCDIILQMLYHTSPRTTFDERIAIHSDAPLLCGAFNASSLIVDLADLDYRVRQHVNTKLRDLAMNTSACSNCSRNAAYQLAIFTKVGFGTRVDEDELQLLLSRSGRTLTDIASCIEDIKARAAAFTVPLYNHKMLEIVHAGYLMMADVSYSYRNTGELESLIRILEGEAARIAQILGPIHSVTHLLRRTLYDVYHRQRSYSRAIDMCKEMISHYNEALLLTTGDVKKNLRIRRVAYLLNLTQMACDSWRIPEAIEAGEAALEEWRELQGEDDVSAVTAMHILSQVYSNASEYDKAISLIDHVATKTATLLGPQHPHLVTQLGTYGSILMAQDRYHEAGVKFRRALEIANLSIGGSHPDTLVAKQRLAELYDSVGRLQESLDLLIEVRDVYVSRSDQHGNFSPEYPELLIAICDTLRSMKRYGEARRLALEAMSRSEELFGRCSHTHVRALGRLIYVRRDESDLAGLDALAEELVELCRQLYGATNGETYLRQKLRAEVYSLLGDYSKATDLLRDTVKALDALSIPDPRLSYSCNYDLAFYLTERKKWGEAIPFFHRALQLSRQLHEENPEELLSDMDDLAEAYQKTGDLKAELVLRREILEMTERVHQRESLEAVDAMCDVARVHFDLRQFYEGEQLYRVICPIRIAIEGRKSDETLTVLGNLAFSMSMVGRLTDDSLRIEEALKIEEEVFETSLQVKGPANEDTRDAFNNLIDSYTFLDRHDNVTKIKARYKKACANASGTVDDLSDNDWETDSEEDSMEIDA